MLASLIFFVLASSPVLAYDFFVRGDANLDGIIGIADAVYLVSYIFAGGQAPNPWASGDANCDRTVDISDAVYLVAYIFNGGLAPCAGCQ